jgi:thiamine biosynthesis lipoprotein
VDCAPDLQEVWQLCHEAKLLSDGYFDPWCVDGGFDPSGYVKGWASDRAISMLKADGVEHIQINAAGDLSLAGGHQPGKPWSIGIRHPEDAQTIVKVFDIIDGAIATSGTYERGSHIKDPHTGLIAIGARSATVYGPNGGIADALATALIVAGKDGAYLFQKPELTEYHCWVIERHSDEAWSV